MTADEFRAELRAAQMTQRGFASFTATTPRTVQRWTEGNAEIPGWVPVMLRLIKQTNAIEAQDDRGPDEPIKRAAGRG